MAIRAGHKVVVSDFDILGIFADKTADETVTSSTTLQDDDQLFLPVAANARYLMDAFFIYTGAGDPAGGLRMGWTGPSGATMKWTNFGTSQNVSPTLVNYNVVVENIGGARGVGTNGATEMSCQPRGRLATAGTGGTLRLQWAQGVSNATGTVLKAGSCVRLVRIA